MVAINPTYRRDELADSRLAAQLVKQMAGSLRIRVTLCKAGRHPEGGWEFVGFFATTGVRFTIRSDSAVDAALELAKLLESETEDERDES